MNHSTSAESSDFKSRFDRLRRTLDGSANLVLKEPWPPTAKPWLAPPDEELTSFEGSFCPRKLRPYTKAKCAKYVSLSMRPPAQPMSESASAPALTLSVDP